MTNDPNFGVRPNGTVYAEQDVSNLSEPVQFMVTAKGLHEPRVWETTVKLALAGHPRPLALSKVPSNPTKTDRGLGGMQFNREVFHGKFPQTAFPSVGGGGDPLSKLEETTAKYNKKEPNLRMYFMTLPSVRGKILQHALNFLSPASAPSLCQPRACTGLIQLLLRKLTRKCLSVQTVGSCQCIKALPSAFVQDPF